VSDQVEAQETGEPRNCHSEAIAPGARRAQIAPPERPLFEPPRIRSEEEGKRPTSWLEFFLDLVFVVAVDQVARRLQHGVTGNGALVYLALYGPIWWARVGFVIYTDRFGTDDISDRFMTLVQIGAALVIRGGCRRPRIARRHSRSHMARSA